MKEVSRLETLAKDFERELDQVGHANDLLIFLIDHRLLASSFITRSYRFITIQRS